MFNRIKAGHTGTLDPLATGMLPILLGEATRFSELGLDANKSYAVSLDLSYQTDTLDAHGKLLQQYSSTDIDTAAILKAVNSLKGRQQQIPPAYSAIRVGGKRAYDMVRQGRAVDLPPRNVHIEEIQLKSWKSPVLNLYVKCSKGTYIRSLARDIGSLLHTGGCIIALRRLSIGAWNEELMVDMTALDDKREILIRPLPFWLKDILGINLSRQLARRFVMGQRLPVSHKESDLLTVYCGDVLLGTGAVRLSTESGAHILHPKRVLLSSQQSFI